MGNRGTFTHYRDHFEAYLLENRFCKVPSSLYDPINYIMSIRGKRFRPLLTILGFLLFDRDYEESFPAALAIELFHNFTLVHDDIIDNAQLRRGMEPVHIKFGLNKAILAGDVMLVYASRFLTKGSSPEISAKLLDMFNETAVMICEGQQYDIDFETATEVSLDEYLHMIEFKTASLLGCALATGAIRASAETAYADMLYACGRDMGMAFQVKDDYLDCFGDPESTGKQVGGDIIQCKKTYPILKALELAGPEAAALKACYNDRSIDPEEKVDRVLDWFDKMGVAEQCEAVQFNYFEKAMERLDKVGAPDEQKDNIRLLFKALYDRSR